MTYHDLYDDFDCPFPDPRTQLLPTAPPWSRRQVMMTYRDGTDNEFAVWFGYLPDGTGITGASLIGTQGGTATWDDNTTTPIQRRTATDIAAETDPTLTGNDMFKRHYIDQHPEQTWKHSTELVVGDRIMDLTTGALGLPPDSLPAVIDMIDTPYDPDDRRSVHYVASRPSKGMTQLQGASHRFVHQWVRLEDAATT